MSESLLGVDGTIGAHHVGREQHGEFADHHGGGYHIPEDLHHIPAREYDEAVLALRTQAEPVACRVIAERLGIPQHTVINILRRHGVQGQQYRARHRGRPTQSAAFNDALDMYGGLYIERAELPDGRSGFLVTLGNEFPGMACSTLLAALKSAIQALGNRECAHGGVG